MRPAIDEAVLRLLTTLGEHVLTGQLNRAIDDLERALGECGAPEVAAQVRAAQDELAVTIGHLNARGTRARAYRQQEGDDPAKDADQQQRDGRETQDIHR